MHGVDLVWLLSSAYSEWEGEPNVNFVGKSADAEVRKACSKGLDINKFRDQATQMEGNMFDIICQIVLHLCSQNGAESLPDI